MSNTKGNATAATVAQKVIPIKRQAIVSPAQKIGNTTAPDYLRDLPGWLIWRFEQREGEPKPRKVPYYANGGKREGKQGAPEDRAKMTTFDTAKKAAEQRGFDGVGLAVFPEWGLVALDFDNCVKDGVVDPEVERLVSGTYCELSPSGKGVRAFMCGQLDNQKDRATPDKYGFEVFSTNGYVTFTGNVLEICELIGNENTVAKLSREVIELHRKRFKAPSSSTSGAPLSELERQVILNSFTEGDFLVVDSAVAGLKLERAVDRDLWIDTGLALASLKGTEFEERACELWHRHSERYQDIDHGYDYDDAQRAWDGFEPDRITYKSIISKAQADGWKHPGKIEPIDPHKFQVVPAHEFASGPPPSWIVEDVLPRAELVVVYGESGSGKSFFVLDMVAAIARGTPWRDLEVEQGRVVYVAAEGAGGFRKRLQAYGKHHGIDLEALPFGVVAGAPNFLTDDDKALALAIQAADGASVIVIDTLAQTTPGANENAGEDMGKALARCKRLHAATGALVLLVHHSGKDASKGARGWSGIRAAVDAELEITRNGDARTATITKQKDGEDGKPFGFRLQVVELGANAKGKTITSCVLEHTEIMPEAKIKLPSGSIERKVLAAAQDLIDLGDPVVAIEKVIEAVRPLLPFDKDDGKPDKRRQLIKRAISTTADKGFFELYDNMIRMPLYATSGKSGM